MHVRASYVCTSTNGVGLHVMMLLEVMEGTPVILAQSRQFPAGITMVAPLPVHPVLENTSRFTAAPPRPQDARADVPNAELKQSDVVAT